MTASLRTFLSESGFFFFFLTASVVVKNTMIISQFYAVKEAAILPTVAFAPSV